MFSSLEEITFREMQLADLKSVWAIDQQPYGSHWTREQFVQFIQDDSSVCSVAEKANQLVGFFICRVLGDETGELLHLAVAQAIQGRGLGRRVFQKILAVMREKKCKKMFLEVRASNAKAIGLYQSFGMKQAGIRKKYYTFCDPDEDAWIFRIKI